MPGSARLRPRDVLVEQTVAVQPERLGRAISHLSHDGITTVNAALHTVLDR